MATTEHATNAQMAEIMGWYEYERYWYDKTDTFVWRSNIPEDKKYFNPITDLNHAALVEARLAELGLQNRYMRHLTSVIARQITDRPIVIVNDFLIATASAQTRCDAAWATWHAWQQREKE